jgi:hypothetical protein
MNPKIKRTKATLTRRRPGRPAGKGETGAIYADVDRGYAAFCRRNGIPLPGKWKGKRA